MKPPVGGDRSAHASFASLRHRPYPFLLEGAGAGGARGRYSWVGAAPLARLAVRAGGGADPLEAIGAFVEEHTAHAGRIVVGFLGYDLGGPVVGRALPRGAGPLPDAHLAAYEGAERIDHAPGAGAAAAPGAGTGAAPGAGTGAAPGAGAGAGAAPGAGAGASLEAGDAPAAPLDAARRTGATPAARADLDRAAYGALVRRALEHIRAGDVYQVNLSRRFTAPLGAADPFALYERLQRASPAPFGAFVDLGDAQLLSVSPELFLRVTAAPDVPGARRVETRPIKGTRPRDPAAAADRAQAAALRASEKDLAEHLMIVDLERNDLGRVARTGTVTVESLFEPYALPTLHHLESRVTALLRDGVSVAELLRATFPGGSITGAPKIRAMEVIGALEGAPRGPYCGAIGVFGPGAELTLSIAIRTAVVAGGTVEYRAGGGIVADSDPDAEFDETAWKAEAFFRAL